MTTGRLVKSLAALSVTGVAVLGFQAPAAVAQQGPPPDRPCGQGNGNPPQYPPGQQKKNGSVDDETPDRGQSVRATSGPGAFDPNSRARACLHSTPIDLGIVQVAANGAASIALTIPADIAPGLHHIGFNGYFQGQPTEVNVPITVLAAALPGTGTPPGAGTPPGGTPPVTGTPPVAGTPPVVGAPPVTAPGRSGAAPGQTRNTARSSRLPRTGADHVLELTAAGLGLVALGGGVLVVSRRRREEAPGFPA